MMRDATRAIGAGTWPITLADLTPVLRRVATALVGLAALGIVAGHVANRATPVDTWWVGSLGLVSLLGLTGCILVFRLEGNPLGWIFVAGALGQGVTAVTREWAVYATATQPGALPGASWVAWVGACTGPLGLASLPLALLHFPDGRLPGRAWRPVRWLVVGALAATIAGAALEPGAFTDDLPRLVNPLGADWVVPWGLVAFVVLEASLLPSLASLIVRWRRSDALGRRQLRLVVLTGTILVVESLLDTSPLSAFFPEQIVTPAVICAFVASLAFAAVRYHLWDLDVIVNVSVVAAAVTVVLAVLLASVLAGTWRAHALIWPVLAAAAVAVLAFLSMRNVVEAMVERLTFGRARDPRSALAGLSQRVGRPQAPELVLTEAVASIAASSRRLDLISLQVPGWPAVETGQRGGEVQRLPLAFQGVPVGSLEVTAKRGARVPGPGDAAFAALLTELAAVVHAVVVTHAVAEARLALANAREEERTRLRRELHDGLGPALAAIKMQAEGGAVVVRRDADRAAGIMDRLVVALQSTITDVRRIVYDLQPPVLDALGLVGALGERAAAFSSGATSGLHVTVTETTPVGTLPPAIELAAYRIVCEALANVARHAEAGECLVTLTRDPDALRLRVADDGHGARPHAVPGIGTASMMERAGELGGSCTVTSTEGAGTTVLARLPIPTEAGRDD